MKKLPPNLVALGPRVNHVATRAKVVSVIEKLTSGDLLHVRNLSLDAECAIVGARIGDIVNRRIYALDGTCAINQSGIVMSFKNKEMMVAWIT